MKGKTKAQKMRDKAHRQRMEERKRQRLNWWEERRRTVSFPDHVSAMAALLPWIQRRCVLFSEFQIFLTGSDILTFNTDLGDDTAERFPEEEQWLRLTGEDNVDCIEGFVDLDSPEGQFSRVTVRCTGDHGEGNLLRLDFPLSHKSLGEQETQALAFLEEAAEKARAQASTT